MTIRSFASLAVLLAAAGVAAPGCLGERPQPRRRDPGLDRAARVEVEELPTAWHSIGIGREPLAGYLESRTVREGDADPVTSHWVYDREFVLKGFWTEGGRLVRVGREEDDVLGHRETEPAVMLLLGQRGTVVLTPVPRPVTLADLRRARLEAAEGAAADGEAEGEAQGAGSGGAAPR